MCFKGLYFFTLSWTLLFVIGPYNLKVGPLNSKLQFSYRIFKFTLENRGFRSEHADFILMICGVWCLLPAKTIRSGDFWFILSIPGDPSVVVSAFWKTQTVSLLSGRHCLFQWYPTRQRMHIAHQGLLWQLHQWGKVNWFFESLLVWVYVCMFFLASRRQFFSVLWWCKSK